MSDQPVLYAALYGHQTDKLNEAVRERLAANAARLVTHSANWVADAIREAYTRGVADGFAQGVAAEARPSSSPATPPNPGEAPRNQKESDAA